MSHTVTALFETRQNMEAALQKLEMLGVTQSQIGVIMNDDMPSPLKEKMSYML